MTIQEIKDKLTLAQVLQFFHLKPDKNHRLHCPFHEDKTPSFQVYYKTHSCYCFSTNCKTHGKSLDVIDFIMHKEDCTKREAILKAKSMIEGETKTKPMDELPRIAVLTKMFSYFKNGVHNSKPAKEYMKKRNLNWNRLEIGYNSGQFHHGARKDKHLIESCVKHGLLLDQGNVSRTGGKAYKPFGKWCIVFALRNQEGQIAGMYFRSTRNNDTQRHFYLKGRQGLYPRYPKPETKRLIITESIIDATSLGGQADIIKEYEILALYGTNGWTVEHSKALNELKDLEEVIFFLNGDEPGRKAVEKYATELSGEYPNVKISNVEVPEGEDVNSLLQSHTPDVLCHLIENRKEYKVVVGTTGNVLNGTSLIFSDDQVAQRTESVENKIPSRPSREEIVTAGGSKPSGFLDASNPYNIKYRGSQAKYQIKGFRLQQLDSLKVTLQIVAQ